MRFHNASYPRFYSFPNRIKIGALAKRKLVFVRPLKNTSNPSSVEMERRSFRRAYDKTKETITHATTNDPSMIPGVVSACQLCSLNAVRHSS